MNGVRQGPMLFRRTGTKLLLLLSVTLSSCSVVAASAYADEPAWAISSASSPTNFSAGDETGDDMYVLTVVDAGDGSTDGSGSEIADSLPSGLVASSISGRDLGNEKTLSCSLTPTLGCSYEGSEVAPGDVLQIQIAVKVSSSIAPSVVNSATVTGGGAQHGASTVDPTTISPMPAGFGISDFAGTWSGAQAGANVNLTTGFTLNQVEASGEYQPAAFAKDVEIKLPAGVFPNAKGVPVCTATQIHEDGGCEEQAAVGVVFASLSSGVGRSLTPYSSLLYNAAPEPGQPAAFMFRFAGTWVRVQANIGAEDDYRTDLRISDIPQVAGLLSMEMTLWGVPGAYNDPQAGPDHVLSEAERSFGPPGGGGTASFLSNGGACESPGPTSTLSADSWEQPGVVEEASSNAAPWTGCDRLALQSSLSVVPDASEADEPSGYAVDLRLPSGNEPTGLASAELRDAAVTLPEGADFSLSTADGLEACSEAQVGLDSLAQATCPDASKVGEVKVQTPLLASSLDGNLFFAAPNANPSGAPLALYLVAEGDGVLIKLPVRLEPNPVTGQLTMALRELPRLPISELDMRLYGGERALLTTPSLCGSATAMSELTPWSGDAPVFASSNFQITSGVNGTPCTESLPFGPVFQAGSTTNEEGAYDSLTLLVSREDQEEALGAISIQAPPAVAQMFSGVSPCDEPYAAEGTCPAASEIGVVDVQGGLGSDPSDLSGEIYLTGPYGGASQGLSIVLPVDPGPLALGTVVVRATEQIDPSTGRLSIVSDPLPTVADGVPLEMKALVLQLDRGEFQPNPDGCEPLTVTGTLTSPRGSSVAISTDPLGTAQCKAPPATTGGPASEGGHGSPSVATVSIAATHIKTTAGGEAIVELTCKGTGACRGRLTLTVQKKDRRRRSSTTIIATTNFSVPPGESAAVKLRLDTAGRALLRADHGRLRATLTVLKSFPAPSQVHTDDVQLVQETAVKARGPRT
jgi:hypothetical protein